MIKKRYENFNEDLYIIKLKNGMQVHILPKNEPYYTTYVEVSIPYGALDLEFLGKNGLISTPYGSAHFLEHKIFAMPEGDAFAKFSMLGVDANAMTSYNQTSYLFTATENLMPALKHLFLMLDTPHFTKENVDFEKSIIAEELKMYLDDPNMVMQNQMMEHLYQKHPIRYDIGGTLSSIEDMTPDMLMSIYENFYHPTNRLVTIAGKVNLKELNAFFKAYDQKYPVKHPKTKTLMPKEPNQIFCRYHQAVMPLGMNKLMMGIKLKPQKGSKKEQVKREMALTMMLNMLLGQSSETYTQLLQESLINQSFYIAPTFEKGAENILIFAESKHVHKLKKILTDLFIKDAYDLLTEKAFERFKKVYLGQFVFALNSLETKAYLYGKYYHLGVSLFDAVDLLNEISYSKILEALQSIQKNRISTLIYKKA
jgi:predicted Zn-dependent peptidase